MTSVVDVPDDAGYATAIGSGKCVCYFWADFVQSCAPGGQMDTVFAQLSSIHTQIKFLKVEAEALQDTSEKLEVSVVPTFLLYENGKVVDKVEGANPPELAKKVEDLKKTSSGSASSETIFVGTLEDRLTKLTNTSKVMLFMKGTPDEPRCGFSRKAVALLQKEEVSFGTFDILSDEDVRQGLKTFSNWPTYPQLYVGGKLLGGLDILNELAEDGDLKDALGGDDAEEEEEVEELDLNARIAKLLDSAPVLLFMKGIPAEPRCGFSRKIVGLLQNGGVEFEHFDILEDEEIRQGLKTYSDWPTYPQLYVKSKLVGGLDIVTEMAEDAEEGQLGAELGL
jgi:Grx4 family monothiol glutaredoxin